MRREAKADVNPRRQRSQYSCMSTSMAMCLTANGVETTEDEVNKVMGARPMKGASWEQALACAQHYGMRATLIVPATLAQVKAYTDRGIPVMIAWNPEGRDWSHASVVFDVDDEGNVHVADPNIPDPDETVRIVPKKDFYGKWSEKWPNYMVRRPAMAVEREVTVDGRQVMASVRKVAKKANYRRWVQQVPGAEGNEALERAIGLLDELARQEGFVSMDIEGALSELFFDLGSQGRPFPKPNHWALQLAKALRFNARAEYQKAVSNKTSGLNTGFLDATLARYEATEGFDLDMANLREEAEAYRASRVASVTSTHVAAEGLYGFTKRTQRDCDSAINKLSKEAKRIAKQAWTEDSKVSGFFKTHNTRSGSASAAALLAALGEAVPMSKEAAPRKLGLYGFPHKTANRALKACTELRDKANALCLDLHERRADQHGLITGFLKQHTEEGACPFANMLNRYYPDAPGGKTASGKEAAGTQRDIDDNIDTYTATYNNFTRNVGMWQIAPTRFLGQTLPQQWLVLMVSGRKIMEAVLSVKSIPKAKLKAVELSARTFHGARKSPKDPVAWLAKTKRHLDTALEAATWPEKVEGGLELFVVGDFKLHNTIHLEGTELEDIKKAILMLGRKIKTSALPDFDKVLYGDFHLVNQISKSNTAAWYLPGDDSVYFRPSKKTGMDEIHALIHELGHRYLHKFANRDSYKKWQRHHLELSYSFPKVEYKFPEVGEVIPNVRGTGRGKNKVLPVVQKIVGTGPDTRYYIDDRTFVTQAGLRKTQQAIAKGGTFPTPYSATSPDEHFCEALALLSLGKLKDEHKSVFLDIWK